MIQVKGRSDLERVAVGTSGLGATYCARVTFEGADYESTIAGNVWSPAAYPAGWRKL